MLRALEGNRVEEGKLQAHYAESSRMAKRCAKGAHYTKSARRRLVEDWIAQNANSFRSVNIKGVPHTMIRSKPVIRLA